MAKPGPPTLTDPYGAPPDSDAVPAPVRKSVATHTIARISLSGPVAPPQATSAAPVLPPPKLPPLKLPPQQLAAPQLAAPQLAVPQLAAPQLAAPQPAAPQLAAQQLAAPYLAVPQLFAPPADAAPAPMQEATRVSAPRLSAPRISNPSTPSTPSTDGRSSFEGAALPLRDSGADPQALPTTKQSRKQKRRRTGLAIAIGLLSVALLGAGLMGSVWLLDHREVPVFPQGEVGMLPETTAQFSRYHTHGSWFDESEPDEARWSRLAHDLCGGHDVYRLLMESKYARSEVVRALDERHHTGKALECGKAVAARLGRSVFVVRTPIADRAEKKPEPSELSRRLGDAASTKKSRPERMVTRSVAVYELTLDELPETTSWFIEQRERGGLMGTRCVAGGRKESCSRSAHSSARLEKTNLWVSGPLADIERFGREFAADGANQVDHEKEFLALAEGLAPLPNVTIGTHDTFDMGFVFNLGLHLPVTGLYDAESSIALLDAVSRYEAAWSLTWTEGPLSSEMTLQFLVPEKDDAIDLVLDLKEWKVAFKELLDRNDESLAAADLDLDQKGVERRAGKARHAVGERALKDAAIFREDRLITMIFTLEPDEDERSDIADLKEDLADRAQACAEVVQGLMAGDRPDDYLLREIGGSELVDAVKDPERRDLHE